MNERERRVKKKGLDKLSTEELKDMLEKQKASQKARKLKDSQTELILSRKMPLED
jgi:hypothetical protein